MRPATFFTLLAVLAAAACGTPEGQRTQHVMLSDGPPAEAVTVVTLSSEVDDHILACVDKALRKAGPGFRYVEPSRFRKVMFPWFEPGTTPTSPEGVARVMNKPLVQARVAELGVRYVVAVKGATVVGSTGGFVSAGPPSPYGGGFGAQSWDRATRITATVLDLKAARPAADFGTSAESHGFGAVLFVVPVIVPPGPTETPSCKKIADQVVAFLAAEREDR